MYGGTKFVTRRGCRGAAQGAMLEALLLLKVSNNVWLRNPPEWFWVGAEAERSEAGYVIHVGGIGGMEGSLFVHRLVEMDCMKLWIDGCSTKFGQPFDVGASFSVTEQAEFLGQRDELISYVEFKSSQGEVVENTVYGLPCVVCLEEERREGESEDEVARRCASKLVE